MRHDGAVRRVAEERDGGQQRRLEPAAVLVVPLEVHVGGRPAVVVARTQIRPLALAQDGEMRDARVEPDVEDVRLLGEVRVAAAVRAGRQEVLGRPREPGVAALLPEDPGDVVEELPLLGRVVGPGIFLDALAVRSSRRGS